MRHFCHSKNRQQMLTFLANVARYCRLLKLVGDVKMCCELTGIKSCNLFDREFAFYVIVIVTLWYHLPSLLVVLMTNACAGVGVLAICNVRIRCGVCVRSGTAQTSQRGSFGTGVHSHRQDRSVSSATSITGSTVE